MIQYQSLLKDILINGVDSDDRTGTGTKSVFGRQLRFDLTNGQIPVVTTKKLYWKGVVHELLWFISGSTNVEYLQKNGVKIWDEWADDNGDLGPVYGKQWRNWQSVDMDQVYDAGDKNWVDSAVWVHDQLGAVIQQIKDNPNSRRHIVSAWNVGDIPKMALPPCHLMFQFYVRDGKLSCQLYQRSADVFLGVPFNIASYALLTHMIAHVTGLKAHHFVHTFGDVHIYNNHLEQIETQLKRKPLQSPSVFLNPTVKDIDDFKFEDIGLIGYKHHPPIKGEVSV